MRQALLFLATCLLASAEVPTEREGLLEVEAENFDRQKLTEVREWVVVSNGAHAEGASGNAYVEVLPDTRATHDDKLIRGENFTNEPGVMAVLEYDVSITNAGRYFVWVRACSTGTEDNGIHVGIDGSWPESGQRMQWCEGKNAWTWASKQRTAEQHCGVPGLIWLDIDKPGRHTVMFSMREDGFEMDAWALASSPEFIPEHAETRPNDLVPAAASASRAQPEDRIPWSKQESTPDSARASPSEGGRSVGPQ